MRVWGIRGLIFFTAVISFGFAPRGAMAAPSLVLLEDNGDLSPTYRHVIEGIAAVIVGNNLSRVYDHIDVLSGDRATKETLFAQIKKRGARGLVDIVILTHGD